MIRLTLVRNSTGSLLFVVGLTKLDIGGMMNGRVCTVPLETSDREAIGELSLLYGETEEALIKMLQEDAGLELPKDIPVEVRE